MNFVSSKENSQALERPGVFEFHFHREAGSTRKEARDRAPGLQRIYPLEARRGQVVSLTTKGPPCDQDDEIRVIQRVAA